MRRLLWIATALAFAASGSIAFAAQPAAAVPETPITLDYTASTTNDLLNRIPGLGGPDTRHVCLIFDRLNKSYCIYVPLP